jgi:hypothetical protein
MPSKSHETVPLKKVIRHGLVLTLAIGVQLYLNFANENRFVTWYSTHIDSTYCTNIQLTAIKFNTYSTKQF